MARRRFSQVPSGDASPQATYDRSLPPPAGLPEQVFLARQFRQQSFELRDRPAIIWDLGKTGFKDVWRSIWFKLSFIASLVMVLAIPVIMLVLALLSEGDVAAGFDPQIHLFSYLILTPFAIFYTAVYTGKNLNNDLAHKTIAFYLVRPLTRSDYFLARLITSMLIIGAVVIIPNILIWMAQMGFSRANSSVFVSDLWSLGAVVLYGLIYVLLFSLFGLALSASTTHRFWAMAGTLIIFSVTLTLAEIAAGITGNDHYYLISVVRSLDILGHNLLGVESGYDVAFGMVLGSLALMALLCVGFIHYRLKNMEGVI